MPATTEFRLGNPAGIADGTPPFMSWLDASKGKSTAHTRNSLT
jgi:hypothetical protein